MTVVAGISDNTDKKNTSNFNKIDTRKNVSVSTENPTKDELKAEFKEVLNDALDILEGKKPQKTLRDVFNG